MGLKWKKIIFEKKKNVLIFLLINKLIGKKTCETIRFELIFYFFNF
jgi:hypothetical protein